MARPDIMKRVAACAPGKDVCVVGPDGQHRLLWGAAPESNLDAESLKELDSQIRATLVLVNEMAARMDKQMQALVDRTTEALEETIKSGAARDEAIAKSILELSASIREPVQPVYDDRGMLIGAKRVKQLKGQR